MGMLVLTRNAGEGIRIGDNIRVSVVSSRPGAVRLGIEAPEDMVVLRDELVKKDRKQDKKPCEN